MRILERLERKLPFLAITNLTAYLIGGQVLFFLLYKIEILNLRRIILLGADVYNGEYWRLFSFLFVPASDGIFIIFFWYLYYLYGNALESSWGSFKYTLYILTGYLLTLSAAFIFPFAAVTNYYFYLSIFFAFAYLFPDFEILIFFVLPVKIKWIAALTAALFLYQAVTGEWSDRAVILLSVGNFLLFFSKDIFVQLRHGNRLVVAKAKSKIPAKAIHTCSSCGVRDIDDFYLDFRYRTEGGLSVCYCANCLAKIPKG